MVLILGITYEVHTYLPISWNYSISMRGLGKIERVEHEGKEKKDLEDNRLEEYDWRVWRRMIGECGGGRKRERRRGK